MLTQLSVIIKAALISIAYKSETQEIDNCKDFLKPELILCCTPKHKKNSRE